LSALYDRHAPRLYAYACVLARSKDEAADIVQECFVRIAERLPGIAGRENLEAYLLVMVRNEAFRAAARWRAWRRRNEAAGTIRFDHQTAAATPEDRETAERIQTAVAELPPDQREVVFLKIWENLTFARIGELLGISLNTAASRYRYALDHLRRRLEP
jgi:RNA polymerase sigma-70 factor, ECF subfamily